MKYKVFYAWQSELVDTQKFIKKHLRKVVKLFEEQGDNIDIIFYPAQDEAGSPSLPDLIVEQIKKSDVFIADLTTVVKLKCGKEISNANVMYELGIARAYLGENRIIMLVDEEFTVIDKLAFDINHSRITSLKKNNDNFYKDLFDYIKSSINYAKNHRDILNYSMNNILSNLLIIYNNCFRLLSGYEEIIDNIEISTELVERVKNRIFWEIQISNNFEPILKNMNDDIKQILNTDIFEQSFKITLVELMKAIEHYCFVFQKNSGSFFSQVEGECGISYLMDSCSTFLKIAVADDEINKLVFFRDKTYLLSTQELPICDCFDKRCIDNYLSDVKEAKIKMPNGLVTNIKDHKYIVCDKFFTITPGAEEVFTELLVKILSLTENILKELGLIITRKADEKEQNYFSFHKNR